MRQRKRLEEQEAVEVMESSQEATLQTKKELELHHTEGNPGLTALAAYLDATAPPALVDPAFRLTLQNKLLGMQAERPTFEEKDLDSMTWIAGDVLQESLLITLTHEIIDFPDDERTALLIDLANRTGSGGQLTQLEQAFLEVGIQLQDYESLLPKNPSEHRKYISSLSLAYKRVAEIQSSMSC